jgi:HTH-type transcriptional regulator/antitoxin MqsA
MNKNICPICETGTLSNQVHTGEIQYRKRTVHVTGLEYSRCDSCGADPVLAKQAKRNQLRYSDTKRATDGLLSSADIRTARRYLGLTQHAASSVFGGGLNAFSKYERGEVIQSEAMDKLIRLTCRYPDAWDYLNSIDGSRINEALSLKSRDLTR